MTNSSVNETLSDKVAFLYSDSAGLVELEITRLVERYGREVDDEGRRLTHRDSIMITYGDSFRGDDAVPLQYLRRFAENYLEGVLTAVHLLPCFPFSSDDGFSVKDYYRIDPELGDWDDVLDLGRKFDLMFDAVINHISKESDWFRSFLAGEAAYQDYFIKADPEQDHSRVVRPRALPLLHPYLHQDGTVHLWTTFSEDQVDLNFRSPQVFLQILDVLLFYASRGARFIRFDAIAFLWKEPGTTCIHLEQTHRIVQLYREIIARVAPSTVLITETNVPHQENISYFGNGSNEAHMVYNFTLPPLLVYSIHREDVTVLTQWASSLKLPSQDVCFFNFTASHDGVGVRPLDGIVTPKEIEELAAIGEAHGGFVSMKSNSDGSQSPYEINCNYFDFVTDPTEDREQRIQRFMLTQSVMLAMPGVPGIYYHSLMGSGNDREAADSSGIKRRINRQKVVYDEIVKALENEHSLRHQVYQAYRRLLLVRRAESLFDPFGDASYHQDGAVFTVERERGEERLFAVHNFSSRPATVTAPVPRARDLLSDASVNGPEWRLEPFEFRWFKQEALR